LSIRFLYITRHLDRFRQALYYLERFDIEGKKWVIDIYNIIRVADQNNILDIETNWGKLGCIDDWFIERVELKKGSWNPSLSTLKSPYKRRYKTFTKLYSIGHRKGERTRARAGGPYLAKRRKITSVNPWTGYIISYLELRRVNRPLEAEHDFGYEPTLIDVEKVILAAVPFVQTFARQLEEYFSEAPPNQRIHNA
jgi:hypothetical protein